MSAASAGSALLFPILALSLAAPALADDIEFVLDGGFGLSVKDNTDTIERLRIDEATGNISRNGVLFIHTAGAGSLAVGPDTLTSSTGINNTAFGDGALGDNTTGYRNSAFGQDALANNQGGLANTAVGNSALTLNVSGTRNTAVGQGALFSNTADYNSAFGHSALVANAGGERNVAVGQDAMRMNTSGNFNTAVGQAALYGNLDGDDNVAVGRSSLFSNTAGDDNIAIGTQALQNATSSRNIAIGTRAMSSNAQVTNFSNIAIGYEALELFNSPNEGLHTMIGRWAGRSLTAGTNSVGVGSQVLGGSSSYNDVAVGNLALVANTGGANVAVGYGAMRDSTSANGNIAIGHFAGRDNTTGDNNIWIGTLGNSTESDVIRIGGGQSATWISGIGSSTLASGDAVFIDGGRLGTMTSSKRFKQDVREMGGASDVLMDLRPVVFRYTEDEVGEEGVRVPQYGLIAEDVAAVAPDLVTRDDEGEVNSVRYHVLAPMLLNEVQKLQARVAELEATATGTARAGGER